MDSMTCDACGSPVCSGTDCPVMFPDSARRRELDNREVEWQRHVEREVQYQMGVREAQRSRLARRGL